MFNSIQTEQSFSVEPQWPRFSEIHWNSGSISAIRVRDCTIVQPTQWWAEKGFKVLSFFLKHFVIEKISHKMGSYLHNLGEILQAFFNCKSCSDVRNTAHTEVTCFQTSSFLLVCMVNLCEQLERELNLHRIFRPHVKLIIVRFSIAMNRNHPQKKMHRAKVNVTAPSVLWAIRSLESDGQDSVY